MLCPPQPPTCFLSLGVIGGCERVVAEGPLAKGQTGPRCRAAAAALPPPLLAGGRPQGRLLVVLGGGPRPAAAQRKQAHQGCVGKADLGAHLLGECRLCNSSVE